MREQARRYLRAFARLDELVESGDFQPRGTRVVWLAERPPRLLEALLIDRINDHVGNLFGLLSLVHRHREIWLAYERLKSDDGRTRNHALEFIDNTLRPGVRRQVMAVIDDLAPAERLAAAGALFHIATGGGRVETLRGLIQAASGGDVAARWLGAAALAYIVDDGVRALVPLAEETATARLRSAAARDRALDHRAEPEPGAGLVDCRDRQSSGTTRRIRIAHPPTPWLATASSSSTWARPTRPGLRRCAAICASSCPIRASSTCTRSKRALVLELFILPFRPSRSAEAYRKIWGERGSPLLFHGEDLAAKLRDRLGPEARVELAMRYQNPSIATALDRLRDAGADRIVVLPAVSAVLVGGLGLRGREGLRRGGIALERAGARGDRPLLRSPRFPRRRGRDRAPRARQLRRRLLPDELSWPARAADHEERPLPAAATACATAAALASAQPTVSATAPSASRPPVASRSGSGSPRVVGR